MRSERMRMARRVDFDLLSAITCDTQASSWITLDSFNGQDVRKMATH